MDRQFWRFWLVVIVSMLCCVTFICHFVGASWDGLIDANESHMLFAAYDGLETALLLLAALLLQDKK